MLKKSTGRLISRVLIVLLLLLSVAPFMPEKAFAATNLATATLRITFYDRQNYNTFEVASIEYRGPNTQFYDIGVDIWDPVLETWDWLEEEADFTVSYQNNNQVGTATVTVSGIGDYSGSKSWPFEIVKTNIWDCYSDVVGTSYYTYTGKAIKPQIETTYSYFWDSYTLTEGVDYTVTYENNVNAGTGYIKVHGIGNFAGTFPRENAGEELSFTIQPRDIKDATVSNLKTVTYNEDNAYVQNPVLTYNGITLVEGKDYTFGVVDATYQSSPGNYYGQVGIDTDGLNSSNFCGYRLDSFKVERADISQATITGLKNVIYTGDSIVPNLTVKMGKYVLDEGYDYSVQYENNLNAGTAKVTIKGEGYYKGTKSATFNISRVDISGDDADLEVYLKYSGMYYNGKGRTQTGGTVIKATVGGAVVTLDNGIDYKVSYKNNVNAGTATMTISGIGNYVGTYEETFKIYRQDINKFNPKVTIKYPNMNYTGKARTQNTWTEVKATIDGKTVTLEQGKDYTISYKNNTNVGVATMTITGKGNFKGTIKKTFKIIPPKSDISSVSKKTATSITVKWAKKTAQTTGYLLQYSTSKSFASDKHSFWIKSNTTVSKVISGLKKGKTYYVRIRTYKEINGTKYYSPWSEVKSIQL